MTASTTALAPDLRRATLGDLRALDLRSPSRDFWEDEAALWDRLLVSWAGLDAAAWRLPGAATSDAGGPDWSLAEHVGHLADWQELAVDYVAVARATGRWPSDDEFDGGDFDRFNEGRRSPWSTMPPDEIVTRLETARRGLLAGVADFTAEELRGDDPWGWVYMTLHGHYLDHLGIVEPWCDVLRERQADGDPFVEDPRPIDHAGFRDEDAALAARFEAIVRAVPDVRWEDGEVTPGWNLRDHVGHLADWAAEGTRAIEIFERRGHWLADPEEGVDTWNERYVAASRGETPMMALARLADSRAAMLDAVDRLGIDDLRSPDGWSWAYDCLYGHLRKHLALIGPWAMRIGWPDA